MALQFTFFKTPKHRVFNYSPIYYDPEKEEREQRAAQLRAEREGERRKKGGDPSLEEGIGGRRADTRTREERLYYPGKRIRGSFQRSLYENRRHAGNNRYLRIIILLSVVVLLVALIYFADGFALLFKALYNHTPTP